MNYFKHVALAFFLTLPMSSFAGEPITKRVKCPIGGMRTKVTQTLSCSSFGAKVTMSFRRPSSCDFITRLPVCKKESFPIYREFSDSEVDILKEIVKEDWYQTSKAQSRYYRAYLIEQQLGTYTTEDNFWLLQRGHFYDPDNTYGNEAYFEAYRGAANMRLKEASDQEKQIILLMAAFARVHSSEPNKAHKLLRLAKKYGYQDSPYLEKYSKLVSNCIKTPSAESCQPQFMVNLQ